MAFSSMMAVLRLAFPLLALVAGQTGQIGFYQQSQSIPENQFIGHFVVLRFGPFDNSIDVNVTIDVLNDTNATAEVDFSIDPSPIVFSGARDVMSQMILIVNNDVWEPDKVIRLKLVVDPPSAARDPDEIMEIWIIDDGDAGQLSAPEMNFVDEVSVEYSLSDPEFAELSNQTCAVWATRDGTASGLAGIRISQTDCSTGFPLVQQAATSLRDFLTAEQEEPLLWQDREVGRKCLVGILSEEAVAEIVFGGFAPPSDKFWIWINADGKLERDEGVCFNLTVANGSASLASPKLALFLTDSGLDGGGRIRCVRGLDCSLDLSNSSALPLQYGFIQPAEEEEDCHPCEEVFHPNFTEHKEHGLATFSLLDSVVPDLGTTLSNDFSPGTYSVCLCGIGVNAQVASMRLSGPRLQNTGFCVMSWPECTVAALQSVDAMVGKDHLQVMTECEKPETTPQGFAQGAHSVLGSHGFRAMRDPSAMRTVENGIYQLCWCRETSKQKCNQLDHFKASAGIFIYVGPNRLPPMESILDLSFEVPSVFGTRLTDEDELMLLPQCGVPHGNSVLDAMSVKFDANNSKFTFGLLRQEDGFLARPYHLCWCQPSHGRFHAPIYSCDGPEDFLADLGVVTLICPARSVDLSGLGKCQQCPLMIQEAGGPTGQVCVIAVNLFLLSVAWGLLMTFFFLALCGSLRCSRNGGKMKLHGMPRKVDDISKERDQLMITTVGLHNLIRSKRHPIPVLLYQTGHFLLDSTPEKPIQLYVMPVDDRSLEIVTKNGESVTFAADSSMGVMEVPFFRTMLHTTLPKCNLPLFVQLLILLLGSIGLGLYLSPSWEELAICIGIAAVLALLSLLAWKQLIRNQSSLSHRLNSYQKHKAKDEKRQTKAAPRGKDRGIRVWKILDLYEHFQGHIRDRNMYYLDPNIVRPLTAKVKLSFSEFIGPDEVEWFVSHWWGTSVSTYCSALKRHAFEVKAKEMSTGTESHTFATAVAKGDQSWSNTTYWICTFSNNQYKIAEELGGGEHTESSFYKALHSQGLKGTCMILDEMTMPLMRSWCLFELLQTIELEEKSQAEMRPFGGLLFCTAVGVLNFGSSTVEMSMKIGERLLNLSLRDAQATTDKDKTMIADLVKRSRGSFDEIDTTLRVHIRDALKACHSQVDTDFTKLFNKLP